MRCSRAQGSRVAAPEAPASELTPPRETRAPGTARALATEPKLLLLDEALTGLTPAEARQGVELVRAIRESGVTIIMVEHVMEVVMPLVDRAASCSISARSWPKACRRTWCATKRSSAPISEAGAMLLEVKSLTTAYHGLVALAEASIDVAQGEIVVVAGANGAGKSTLLKTIAGMEYAPVPARSPSRARRSSICRRISSRRAASPSCRRTGASFRASPVADNLRLGSYMFRGKADREAPIERVFTLFPRLR